MTKPTAHRAPPPPDLLGLPLSRLEETLAPWIDRPFRARQIYQALHQQGAEDFGAMSSLPKNLRQELAERYRIGLPAIQEKHRAGDGTVKYLLDLVDGATIEAVDIPDGERHTLCISSQAGCALACSFCVTGFWGAGRNLTSGEIVGQVRRVCRDGELPDSLNLVFMGMGEPLLNLDNVRTALEILRQDISLRRITVSTSGIVPAIDAMAQWPDRPNLAISLHAADHDLRSRIMPINRTHPLADLMAALRRFPVEKGRKLTFEYILLRGINDSDAHADRLARLLRGLPAKVNLIPMNPDPVLGDDLQPPSRQRIDGFHRRLKGHRLVTTVRRQRGDDVSAACGQLRAPSREPKGFARRALGEGFLGHRERRDDASEQPG
ncbi:MAG: 23S rRNA (adenine(2503)-C(2))-methyltransferase RlmN [Acidobacteriota bacterium]